jgi:hypothetical protein
LRGTPSKKPIADSNGRKANFVLLPDLRRFLATPLEVDIYFVLMPEIIADDCIHMTQLEGGILLSDGFGRRPLAEGGNEGIKRYARVANTHDAIRIRGKRYRFRSNNKGHKLTFPNLIVC